MNSKRSNIAIAQIIGTMLLLLIAIGAISIIYSTVLSEDGPSPETYVKIVGQVIGSNVIFEHQGGEPLELDTKISLTIAGVEYEGLVSNWLNDKNNNDEWNLGERMTFPFEYNLSRLGEFDEVDVVAVDDESNSIILTGPIELNPVSDTGITITVDNPNPTVEDSVKITITVTSYGGDVNGSGRVLVRCLLPDELTYISSDSPSGHGSYNNETGEWSAGDVLVGYPATLNINATVLETVTREFMQVALVLDGSASIHASDWSLMKNGLEHGIKLGDQFPRSGGSVELTVIQFGGWWPPLAQVEVGPVIITDDENDPGYYMDVAQDVISMTQLKGYTPMDCGIRLVADQIRDLGNFSVDTKQVILIITDGLPNCVWIPGTYNANAVDFPEGKASTEEARTYLLETLELNEDNDEFNCLAVLNGSDPPDIDWLNESIVWPEPGYIAPPFDYGAGWVSTIDNWQEFSDRINEIFTMIFNTISTPAIIIDSTTLDLNNLNDQVTLSISPES